MTSRWNRQLVSEIKDRPEDAGAAERDAEARDVLVGVHEDAAAEAAE